MKIFSSIFTSLLVLIMITIAGVMASSYFQKNIANNNGSNTIETIVPIEKPDANPNYPNEEETNKPNKPTGGAGETTPDIQPEEKPDIPEDTGSISKPEENPTNPDSNPNNKPSLPENDNNNTATNAPNEEGDKGENNGNTMPSQPDSDSTSNG